MEFQAPQKAKEKQKSEAELHVRFKLYTYRFRITHMYYWLTNLFNKHVYLNSQNTVYLQVKPNSKCFLCQ